MWFPCRHRISLALPVFARGDRSRGLPVGKPRLKIICWSSAGRIIIGDALTSTGRHEIAGPVAVVSATLLACPSRMAIVGVIRAAFEATELSLFASVVNRKVAVFRFGMSALSWQISGSTASQSFESS
jgi:hypothetical protein